MSRNYIADKQTLDKVREKVDMILANLMVINNDATLKTKVAANYFNTQKNGKVFSVFFNDFVTSPLSTGIRKNDAVGMIARPSTDAVAERNDFDQYAIFNGLTVNGHVDSDGEFVVDYFEGEDGFDKYTKDVYVLFGTSYVNIDIAAIGETISVSDTKRTNYFPMGGAVRSDKTIRPFIPIAKYMASDGSDGKAASISNQIPYYKTSSHNGNITKFHSKGTQYCSTTIQDTFMLETLFQVVFATRNTQSIMKGCSDYNVQIEVSKAESNVNRVILPIVNISKFIVGSCVSVGHMNADSKDRGADSMHNVANRRVVTSVDEVTIDGTTYAAIYLDGDSFSTDATSIVSTMPWKTGATDDVLGTCGSPNSNTDGRNPFVFFGVEMMNGQYEVIGNTKYTQSLVNDKMLGHYVVCYDCANLSSSAKGANDIVVDGYDMLGGANAWKYPSKMGFDPKNPCVRGAVKLDANSGNGYADGIYMNNTEGTYEVLAFGVLGSGADAGLFYRFLRNGLGYANWNFSARLSATGRCGVVIRS